MEVASEGALVEECGREVAHHHQGREGKRDGAMLLEDNRGPLEPTKTHLSDVTSRSSPEISNPASTDRESTVLLIVCGGVVHLEVFLKESFPRVLGQLRVQFFSDLFSLSLAGSSPLSCLFSVVSQD